MGRIRFRSMLSYFVIIVSSLIMLVPFLTTLFNSLKTYVQYTAVPPQWFPTPIQWSNYSEVWKMGPFAQYTWNSAIVTLVSVVGALLSCSMVAYAFARIQFPFRNTLFMVVLGTMMIPPVVLIIPQFVIFKNLSMLDTLTPLWILEWLAQPFGIFLMRQAFLAIPKDYEESAKLDGCNPFEIYWRIFIPMCKPTFATLAVFTFMTKWNEILSPAIFLTSKENFTLPIGILSMTGQWSGNEQYMVAAALMSLVPILLVFLFAEKYFVQGSNSAGIK
ncbi:multiple sugar transport system permease protein [Paenibacillus shirakamiensis]|uniref:Multiple sugar transport system permease protein n=1 Tax=Paenibacillus shirakamiensis TaxID=1265935 RepID=A0ABS4JGW4_9BACL|nr:carbohydrate ABC transporter permease [Paenibacillus shirakamiensis]MBP2000961.1 multiple sugar transport system permease protein [Paenibacillus shirakamiensis]